MCWHMTSALGLSLWTSAVLMSHVPETESQYTTGLAVSMCVTPQNNTREVSRKLYQNIPGDISSDVAP